LSHLLPCRKIWRLQSYRRRWRSTPAEDKVQGPTWWRECPRRYRTTCPTLHACAHQ